MHRNLALWAAVLAVSSVGLVADAQDWGDLRVTFVYGGEPPAPCECKITKDSEFCGKFGVVEEDLVVNAENRGIANVVAYLYLGRGEDAPKAHSSYNETADGEVVLDNNHCRFEPHVAMLRTSQTLVLSNSDDVGHNCKIDSIMNPAINFTIPAKGKINHQFPDVERLPVGVSCSIHPWMSGWLVIKDHPYMAVSDADGKLVIKNLPVGKWTIQFWQEKSGYIDSVTQDGEAVEWSRGRLEVTIGTGVNDLGTVTLAPSLFAE